jgi:two-component system sensor histidine kinase BaeS
MFRFGCLFVLAILLLTAFLGSIAGLVATALGGAPGARPFPAFAVALLIIGLVLVIGFGRAFRRFATPVGDLVDAAGRIESGDFSARVPERGPREVRSLARAFNAMSARLEATDRERRTFLADVSHELRTPLAVIRGQVEAIGEGVYPADAEHLAPITDATQTLEQLVEDLRTLALAEAGALTLAREPVDMVELANESVAGFRATAQAAGVALDVESAGEVPTVSADPSRIRGVLGNLIANAVRHTPRAGRVTVRIEGVPSPAPGGVGARDGGRVEVAVSDTGSGIAAELLPRIFDRFVKAPGSPGSGLGLAIARDLVTAHGGTISAESTQGRGTTIRFSLPVGL